MGEEINPYAAPQSQVLADNADDVRLRQEFLRAEGHLKALGLLIIVLSLMLITAKVMMLKIFIQDLGMSQIPWPFVALGSLSLLPLIAGMGLYFIKRWAGVLVGLLAVVQILMGIVQLPGGLLEIIVQAAVLRFMLSPRARRVLSSDYQDMIRRTPMIKSPAATWIRPVIVLLVLVFAVVFCVGMG